MRIGIDARWIFAELSGIGTYTRELIRGLARIDRENQYVLFFDDEDRMERIAADTGVSHLPNFATHLLRFGVFSAAGQLRLPGVLQGVGLDIFHSPNYMIPFLAFPRGTPGAIRCVVTLHDLIPLIFPQFTPRAIKTRLHPVFRRVMAEVGARADVILTVSETSRSDVLVQLRIPESRRGNVIAVPNGVSSALRPAPREPAPHRTILYTGRFDPYKNLAGLIRAFAELRPRAKTDVRLRIVGPPDPRYPEPRRLAAELGVNPWIDWSGYLADDALARAYQQADVFVLPSRYEGFGLTVLEAMACGTPVVCSNRSSLPEVAGDAARLVDPDDTAAIAGAIETVLNDPATAAGMRERGLAQAARFTWDQTAERTLQAYRYAAELK